MREGVSGAAASRKPSGFARLAPMVTFLVLFVPAVIAACQPEAQVTPPAEPSGGPVAAGAAMIWPDGSLLTYHPDSDSWVSVNEVTEAMIGCMRDEACDIFGGGTGAGDYYGSSTKNHPDFLWSPGGGSGGSKVSRDRAAVLEYCQVIGGSGVAETSLGYLCAISDPTVTAPTCSIVSAATGGLEAAPGTISKPKYDEAGRLIGYSFANVGGLTTDVELEVDEGGRLTGYAEVSGTERTVVRRDEDLNGASFRALEDYLGASLAAQAAVRGSFCANDQGGVSFASGTLIHELGGIHVTSDGDPMLCAEVNGGVVCTGGKASSAVTIELCEPSAAVEPLAADFPTELLPEPVAPLRSPGTRFGGGQGACPVGYAMSGSSDCVYAPLKGLDLLGTAVPATPTPTKAPPCEQFMYERDPKDGVCKPVDEVFPCPKEGEVHTRYGTCAKKCPEGQTPTGSMYIEVYGGYVDLGCTFCPAGTSSTGGVCYPCPAGTTSELGGLCKPKPAVTCEYGHVYDETADKCVPLAYDPAEFSEPCAETGFVRNFLNECVPGCKPGFAPTKKYTSDGVPLLSCYACPRGTTSSGGVCYLCPAGTTSYEPGELCKPLNTPTVPAPTATPMPTPVSGAPECSPTYDESGAEIPCTVAGSGSCPPGWVKYYSEEGDLTTCSRLMYAWASGCPAGFYFDEATGGCVPPSGQTGCYGAELDAASLSACYPDGCPAGSELDTALGCCRASEPGAAAAESCVTFTVDMPSCGGARPGGGSGPVVCGPNDYCCLHPEDVNNCPP